MTNNERKSILYDNYVRESDILQRKISQLKSEYTVNMPDHVQGEVNRMGNRINELVKLLNNLFRD